MTEREADLAHARAAKAEFAKDYDQAFRLYIKSAEIFLHLSRSGGTADNKKQKWKANAAKALERAELIKRFADASRQATTSTSVSPGLTLTPIGIDIFSPQEQFYVLQKGAEVNGRRFPLWDEPTSANFQSEVFVDPDGQPQLSREQARASPVWRRPIILESPPSNGTQQKRHILPQVVLQRTVTDCSVCASISVCLEHGRRFGSSLAESAVHEKFFDSKSSNLAPGVQEGRYDVRVLFNGGWRRIVIDDQMPFHPNDGRLMCLTISPSTQEGSQVTQGKLWPSLLEKAYMKLMGGYDFLGSNSGIDLHALIGWIPEHIDLKWSHFERERTWDKMLAGFLNGRCLITLGTGTKPGIRWGEISLLSSHSYAVIDVQEAPEDRILTILDSWVHSGDGNQNSSCILEIPWSEVFGIFNGIYFSWDPSLWTQQLTLHGMWRQTEISENRTMDLQAKFLNNSSVEGEILVLLTRHVSNTRRTSDFVALHVEVEDYLSVACDFMTNQLLSPQDTYTNSTQVLNRVKIHSPQQSGILRIFISYEGDANEVGYTLSLYALNKMKLSWIEKQTIPPYNQKVEGTFTSKNAGGNSTYPSFMLNPQYRLIFHPIHSTSTKVNVTLTLRCGKTLPVNLTVVRFNGERLSELSEKDLVATSGAYTYGLARLTKVISLGEYSLIASAFEPHHMGAFTLRIEASHPFDINLIPQEGAGMYSRVIRGSWNDRSTARASISGYTENPVFKLYIPGLAQLKIRLQLAQPSAAIALNVTVYRDSRGGIKSSLTQKSQVLTSGPYDDAIAGVATPQVSLEAGRYYIIPSTFTVGFEADFTLVVYSSISGITVAPMEGLGD